MSQRTLASQIGISHSSVSRIINRKTLKMPWGSEIPLKDFFLSRKKFLIDKVSDILLKYGKGDKLTDREIGDILNRKYGLKISRRSVNLYRKENQLGSATARQRGSKKQQRKDEK